MSEDHQSRANLVALTCSERDERVLFTVVVPGGTCALWTLCGSAFGGGGRRAVILRARKIGIIDASCRSVHERAPLFFQESTERAREKGALACVIIMDKHSI